MASRGEIVHTKFAWRRLWIHITHKTVSYLEQLRVGKVLLRLFVFSFIIFSIWVCNLIWFKPFSIELFYERMFIEYGQDDPELMSRLHLLEKYGITYYNSLLTDISDAERDRRYEESIVRNFEMLRTYKRSQQTEEELLSTEILDWYLELEIYRNAFRQYEYPVNHINGIQVKLPRFMMEVHEIKTLGDAEDYLERLSKFDKKFDELIQLLESRKDANVIPPRFILERVIEETKDFISRNVKYNLLYKDFAYKVDKADTTRIVPLAQEELKIKAREIMEDDVFPAYQKLLNYLEMELEEANDDAGVWKLGYDSATAIMYYNTMLMVHAHISQEESAEEYHYRGLGEISDLREELIGIFDSLNFPQKDSISKNLAKINNRLPNDFGIDDNYKNYLDTYQCYSDSAFQSFGHFFLHQPKEPLKLVQVEIPLQNSSPLLKFHIGQSDTSQLLYINLKKAQNIPQNKMPVWVYEKAGGRYIQSWYEQQLTDIPTFRKVLPFDVYDEGWEGYFADLLKDENKNSVNYYDDLYIKIGEIQNELLITSLLVVDTGIHLKKWTREESINFLVENTGLPRENMKDEVDKIVVRPAQATIYKIGKIYFKNLREYTEDALEENFNLKEFHEVILKNGHIPLPVLKKQVKHFVTEKKKIIREREMKVEEEQKNKIE
ncbi:hypothetical protein Fleli_1144 [Bernardetia litoralis DSM 6794]|uniref:DUF885 domain-containing protein n=1 Tax=Bernardetia litoralis (strain ATCC 23117 / DSM 6794 / NBRC 15988 / NCIMB 1366 / Fx l1 / Sio-4) TaxID=880071 RepID=I4AHZ7_BERLS|nr:DUF885 domain-containing protein [Bernardetia litoralis]AFM03582.1 hypothetical protein Fleli_1144 [Bernardetia litoralis DSM 6794]